MAALIAWRIRSLVVTASTNDDVKAAAEAGEAEGLVVHALSQEAGRGRQGRVWQSPEGNLYCSLLLRAAFDPRTIGQLSFVTALAIADCVRHFLPTNAVNLKWPNDVLVDGKKISGILLEAGDGWMVVGIGINIAHHPDNATYPTTSLHANTAPATVQDVLAMLLDKFASWYALFKDQGFEPIRAAWIERAHKGKMIARLPQETIEGDFIDLDLQGRLHLLLADGTNRLIVTGDVFPALPPVST